MATALVMALVTKPSLCNLLFLALENTMQLIDTKTLRDRLLLDDKQEINDALKSAIAGASPRLEAILQTTFTKGSAEDYFLLDGDVHSDFNGVFKLRLSKGFVRAVPALVVSVAETLDGSWTPIAPVGRMDTEKGFMSVSNAHRGKYVKVTYDFGFASSKEVPEWLAEVSVCYAVKVLSMNQVNDRKDELSKVYEFVDSHSAGILDAHLRVSSAAIPDLGV